MAVTVEAVVPSATIVAGEAVRVEAAASAVAGVTVTGLLVPVELPSSAVIIWAPAVFGVTLKVWLPLSPAREGVGGGQHGPRVAGGEADGAGVAGGGVAVGVEGGEREAARRCGAGQAAAATLKWVAAPGCR